MARIAIIYFSEGGRTAWLAEQLRMAAIEAALEPVVIDAAGPVDIDDMLTFDAYAFGSPNYLNYMAGAMKTVFDRLFAFQPVVSGRPFVAFTSTQCGGTATLESLNQLAQMVGLKQAHTGLCWKAQDTRHISNLCAEMLAAILKCLPPTESET